jgi:hypothetical protein
MKNIQTFRVHSMAKMLCPHCGEKLQVLTSKQVIEAVRDVYTNCNNPACLARPIMAISHKGDTQPPIGKMLQPAQVAINFFDSMPDDQKQLFLDTLPHKKSA